MIKELNLAAEIANISERHSRKMKTMQVKYYKTTKN